MTQIASGPHELKSSRSLDHCHPELQSRWRWIVGVYAMFWPSDPQPKVSSTFRSMVDQNGEVVKGSSKVRWPNSTHNYTHNGQPCSLALDFFFEVDGKTAYPPVYMERVVGLSKFVGLFSGTTWGWDGPHLALAEKIIDWEKVKLLEVPGLLAPSPEPLQPVIRVYDDDAKVQVIRGEGDILLRIEHNPKAIDPLRLHVRYEEK